MIGRLLNTVLFGDDGRISVERVGKLTGRSTGSANIFTTKHLQSELLTMVQLLHAAVVECQAEGTAWGVESNLDFANSLLESHYLDLV